MTSFDHQGDNFDDAPVYVISVVAQITGMHAQTLRQYDRVGLVSPQRTAGGGRRYTRRDIDRLRQIQVLSAEGVGLSGIKQILDLQAEVIRLSDLAAGLQNELDALRAVVARAGGSLHSGSLLPATRPQRTEITLWNPSAFR
jgi:MerR family transcriptional regulator, heat shock protein HspR